MHTVDLSPSFCFLFEFFATDFGDGLTFLLRMLVIFPNWFVKLKLTCDCNYQHFEKLLKNLLQYIFCDGWYTFIDTFDC